MDSNGKLVGHLDVAITGHANLASNLGLASKAKDGKVFGFSVGRKSNGELSIFGSASFPDLPDHILKTLKTNIPNLIK